jgi:hypothetical protein
MNPMSLVIRLPTVFAEAGWGPERLADAAIQAATGLNRAVFATYSGGVVIVYPTMTAKQVSDALTIARCTPLPDDCRAAATNAGIVVRDHNGLGDRGA